MQILFDLNVCAKLAPIDKLSPNFNSLNIKGIFDLLRFYWVKNIIHSLYRKHQFFPDPIQDHRPSLSNSLHLQPI